MQWSIKTYKELTKDELYGLLRLRAAVFVVEQDCPYQDVDNKDQKALHVLAVENGEVIAYTRIFNPGDYFQETAIGRVVSNPKYRGLGLGQELMRKSLTFIEEKNIPQPIRISAQTYLKNFYENFGFKQVGIEYMEDDIPHIGMIRK